MAIVNMRITRAIAHDVHRQTRAATELAGYDAIESSQLIPMDHNIQQLITERLVGVLASGASCVEVNVDDDRREPFLLISSMLDAEDVDFITVSQSLARQLSSAQTGGSIKSGVAFFIQGSCVVDDQASRFIVVIKADSDKALSRRSTTNSISFDYIRDLLLSSSQRLLKVALFVEVEEAERGNNEPRTPEDFSIKVYDHLMQNSGDKNAAAYFYKTFLGCKIAINAAVQTRKFLDTALSYINQQTNLSQEEKFLLRGDIISRLRGNADVINPASLARELFNGEQQNEFINQCIEQGLGDAFSKDTTLIKGKLRKQSIHFSSNVTLFAPPEVLQTAVEISNPNGEWTEIKIRGYITQ